MNSLQITAHRGGRLSWQTLLFLTATVGLLILGGWLRDPLPALLALLPAAWAYVCSGWRWRPFRAELDWDALRLPGKPEYRWDDFCSLRFNGSSLYPEEIKGTHGQIQLVHRHGVLEFPKYLDPPAVEVYRVLWNFLAEPRNPEIIPAFEEWVTQQRATFGEQLVHAFAARSGGFEPSRETQIVRRMTAAALGVGAVWLALAWVPGFPANLVVIGGVTLGLSLFVWLISWLHSDQRRVSDWKQSMLVVSPAGFALRQGKLSGVLKWEDLRKLKRHANSLIIGVDGATITIQDLYDRPLAVIQRHLERNWRPQPSGEPRATSAP